MNLTIAIPSYNKENYIKRCIESALIESSFVSKIIVVDNCSTDKTYEIAKQFEPRIACYQNDMNIGMAKNWDRCVELCKTDWLLILHADDELLPNSIQHYSNFVEKYPSVGLIHANSYSITEGDILTKSYTKKNQKAFWKAGEEAMKCHYGVCSAVMIRSDVYANVGTFLESLSSDAEMWSRIASKYDVGFIDIPTVIYHVSKTSTGFDSLVNRNIKTIKKDWDYLNDAIANNYPTKELQEKYRKEYFINAPASYYAVAKANIKVKHYFKALQCFHLIIFHYNAFQPLVSMIVKDIKSKIIKK